METGHPDHFVGRSASDEGLVSLLSKVAFAVALVVVIALPISYWGVGYRNLGESLEFKARVKATALSAIVSDNPDLWMYEEHRLSELLIRYPVALESESARILDPRGKPLAEGGERQAFPLMSRSAPIHDSGRVVGSVVMEDSLDTVIYGTAIAVLLGLILAGALFVALRAVSFKALRRVTVALERAQVTLHSIADAVITTDESERVEYLNPTAERLTGWRLGDVGGKPLSEILQLCNAATGTPVSNPLRQALDDDRSVALGAHRDLVRRDSSRVAIEDNAAPIRDRNGRIVGGVLIFRDVSMARESAQRSAWEASHDVLTGLVNRREFENLVANRLSGEGDRDQVVCFMDLDQFKVVNDSCGHTAGDDLLKEIAALLQSRIRGSDTLARLGGDEFGLLLQGCSIERAQAIAGDLLAAIADMRFKRDAKVFTVGVSIGLASVTGEGTAAEILGMADTACYWAKEQGRNRICVYRAGDGDMAARRREIGWIARINSALAEERFVLYHQSYRALNSMAGNRDHLEILLRMIDEEGNLVSPTIFMPAAERYNLMPAIDRWTVEKVFARYRELVSARGGRPLTCAINLSGTSLNAEGFLDFVRQQAAAHALPPGSICFEITETAAINNLRKVADFIRECKSMGYLFALDDFGIGTSSFGYLKNLPVDYLKIDGSFVKNLERDAIDRAMTETINRIGHIMGIKTVAEYAESEAIIQELTDMGVDYAQGFAVNRPTPLFAAIAQAAPLPLAA